MKLNQKMNSVVFYCGYSNRFVVIQVKIESSILLSGAQLVHIVMYIKTQQHVQ